MDPQAKKRFIAFGITKLVLSAACLVLVGYGTKNLAYFKDSYHGIMSNWNNNLVTGFSNGSPQSRQPYEVLDIWNGSYPGTVNGCYCPWSDSEKGVSSGFSRSTCSYNETSAGCSNIPAVPKTKLRIWNNRSEQLVFSYAANSSFLDLYQNMDGNGNCKPGTMRCGNPSSISKGICVPDNWISCPVTDLRIGLTNPNPSKYNRSATFASYNVYYSTNSDANPIADLQIAEHFVCENPAMAALTPGRKPYELYAVETSGCKADHRYERLDSIGEQFLLEMNDISTSRLIEFKTSNSYLWFRFFRRVIEWKPECLPEVPRLFSMNGELKAAHSICYYMNILTFIFVILGVLFALGQMTIPFKDRLEVEHVYGCYRARICIVSVVVPVTLVSLWRTYPLVSYFDRALSMGCSDAITNVYFDDLLKGLKAFVFYFYVGVLLLTMVLLAIDLVEFLIERKRRREEWSQFNKPEVDIVIL